MVGVWVGVLLGPLVVGVSVIKRNPWPAAVVAAIGSIFEPYGITAAVLVAVTVRVAVAVVVAVLVSAGVEVMK